MQACMFVFVVASVVFTLKTCANSFIWIKDAHNPNINGMQLIKYMIKYDDNNLFPEKNVRKG